MASSAAIAGICITLLLWLLLLLLLLLCQPLPDLLLVPAICRCVV